MSSSQPDLSSQSPTQQGEGLQQVVPKTEAPQQRTPFYKATHAPRYQRQDFIKRIQSRTGRKVICYVAGCQAPIDRDDTVGFVDLLHNIPNNQDLDLMMHTGGGDIDAAEKLIYIVRTKVGSSTLRVVIPEYAKSAGTLMAIGADSIVMSDMSELGPIDPQVSLSDGKGNRLQHSVQHMLDAYEAHSKALKDNPTDPVARIMLNKLEPATIKLCESVLNRSRAIAEAQLRRGMFRNAGNWSQAAGALLDTKRWQSHGQMISCADAQDSSIGLTVEYLKPDSEEWLDYWQLYCLQRLAIKDDEKLFESDYVSLTMRNR